MTNAARDLAAVAAMVNSITEAFPAFAPLLKIPEVAGLLIEASTPGAQWTPAKLQAKLQGTKWWKSSSQSSRQWQVTKLVDPATAAQSSSQIASAILAAAGTAGITLTPTELATMVDNAQDEAWTPQIMQERVVAHAERGRLRAGTLKNTAAKLNETAAAFGVKLAPATAFGWAERIANGRATTDGFESWARDHAKRAYPTLTADIDRGMTVRDIADPYLQTAGELLGLDPAGMDLRKPRWQKALQSRDEKGNITGPMTQLDWERTLMTAPEYGYDKSAHGQKAALQLRGALSRTFGVTA